MSGQAIYERIMRIFPKLGDLQPGSHRKIENSPFTPLSMDILDSDKEHTVIAIAHNSVQNGDNMASPDMEVVLYHDQGIAKAMTYQNDYLGVYQVGREFIGGKVHIHREIAAQLDSFLDDWSHELAHSGYVQGGES